MTGRSFGLLGVPSSAGAHWPGQEKSPAALRQASLVQQLTEHGVDLHDYGDLPVSRMTPDRRHPQNLDKVVSIAEQVAANTQTILAGGHIPLIIGGDCTIALGVLSGFLATGHDPGLMYVDGGVDLYTPDDNPTGILDSMGIAHMLGEPSTQNALGNIGPRHPLMQGSAIVLFGHGPEPRDESRPRVLATKKRMGSFPASAVRENAVDCARRALDILEARRGPFVIHFDVDVIDFVDAPLSDVPLINDGISFADAFLSLSTFISSPYFRGLTVTELNPDHGAEDGSTLVRFVDALALAVASD